MFSSLNPSVLLIINYILVIISLLSGVVFLNKRVPLSYVRVHVLLVAFPPLITFIGLIFAHKNEAIGLFYSDVLAWLMAAFVLMVGLIIQRYCIRYLSGDMHYRKYFLMFTLTTSFASTAWLTGDIRIMVLCWGLTLIGLTILIGLQSAWKVTRAAAIVTGKSFLIGWLALLIAVIWIGISTGHWTYQSIYSPQNIDRMGEGTRLGIHLLMVIAVLVPAAQWPFQRWLIESVAAPTPVSAIMHAGIVNAGGIMLTRFSPLFSSDIATVILVLLASVSVVIGAGISLVHVDYKRLLVGSTIGQMGFMLVQCALGAYIPAIIHLILHGIFKATLFLRSGSAVRHFSVPRRANERMSYFWIVAGRVLALLIGLSYWLSAPSEGYRIVSGLILAWSLSLSWTQLVAFGEGKLGRILGLGTMIIVGAVYELIHHFFAETLHTITFAQGEPPLFLVLVVAVILLLGSTISMWVARHRNSRLFSIIYMRIVHLGEAHNSAVERHPNYLKKYIARGGR